MLKLLTLTLTQAITLETDQCAQATDWCLCEALLLDVSQRSSQYKACKGHVFKSGAVLSKEAFGYGRFTTRMRVPDAPAGTVASFFLDGGTTGKELKLQVVPSMVGEDGVTIGDT